MIYAMFICVYYAKTPQFNSCRDPYQVVYASLADCRRDAERYNSAFRPDPAMTIKGVCMQKPGWSPAPEPPTVAPQAPKLPASFAWRMGEKPPPGVIADKDGMPEGYEMHSGASHNCFAPKCLWFEREK